MQSILVVDDDPEVHALVARALSGVELHFAQSVTAAHEHFERHGPPTLLLLDLALPDGDGFSLCTEFGASDGQRLPVIFLTGSEDSRDVVTAFSLGAEDYVHKPFVALELRARVMGRLERLRDAVHATRVCEIGSLQIDVEHMRTYRYRDGHRCEVLLTPTEQRLLHALAEKPGRLLTREALLSRVWAGAIVGPRTIDTHISNLRTKLGPDAIGIEAVRGVGYRTFESPAAPDDR